MRNFVLENVGLDVILGSLREAKHIEFADCSLLCISEELKFEKVEVTDLKSITLSFNNRKVTPEDIMYFLKVLVKPLAKTPILRTLQALYLPKKVSRKDVLQLFAENGFVLDDVISQ